jgi:hypothetical protein
MTDPSSDRRIDGDAGEANRGVGQERVGETRPGPVQRPPFAPAAGGPGTGAGVGTTPAPPSGEPEPKP